MLAASGAVGTEVLNTLLKLKKTTFYLQIKI
jgi:hypothetical protein